MAAQHASAKLLAFIHRQPRAMVSTVILMGAGLLAFSPVLAQQAARVAANALPVRAPDWLQKGTAASYNLNGTNATVNLTGPATVLHWNSMDVGSAATLRFVMPSSSSRVLNKVDGGAFNNMTTIEGALRSNGQVYIYNPSGIVFGRSAQVNVNSLVASSLKIDEQRFMSGILSPGVAPVFAIDPALGRLPGDVMVEGDANGDVLQRAAITAQNNGLIMLVAPKVTNAGKLSAPDGQVVLAAGSKVYLAAPQDSSMRGLRVEVGSEGLETLAAGAVATNTVNGQLTVQRGNITMVGLSVNQMGMASATTSVNINGSIFLRAQDGAAKAGPTSAAIATRGGTLVLGKGSFTEVLPTLDDKATATAPPAGQAFKPSLVELAGSSVTLGENASVRAPSGKVSITARAKPSEADLLGNASQVVFESGSTVDVAGSTGTVLAMASNVITAELRGTELADNVLLRDSAVRGATVRLDRRKIKGGIEVANVQGYLDLAEYQVGELTATGGSVTVNSEGSIKLDAASRIDVSGGSVNYEAGHVNTSQLSLGGRLYAIETARANLAYDGVVNPVASGLNFEAAYQEGKSAGTVRFNARSLQLQGDLQGRVTMGEKQRDQNAAARPLGGQLQIGNISDTTMDPTTGRANFGELDKFGFSGNIIVGGPAVNGADVSLDLNALSRSGFSRFSALTTGDITLDNTLNKPLVLTAGGELRLGAAGDVKWNENLTMSGGAVTAAALNGLRVGDKVAIDLAGTWQNDTPLATPSRDANGVLNGKITTKGGDLRLYANQLDVGEDARFDVSGGAWLTSAASLVAGNAGSITLQARTQNTSLDGALRLGGGLELSGQGMSRGGTLSLTGRNVVIGKDDAKKAETQLAGDLFLDDNFFTLGGFANTTIAANGNLTLASGASVTPRAASWVLDPQSPMTASGKMSAVAAVSLLPLAGPPAQRQAANLTLRASGKSIPGDGLGVLTIADGASVLADPGASITLSADQQVHIGGKLEAPGGTISALLLAMPPDTENNNYSASRGIWLGSQAQLLAGGSTQRVSVDAAGIATGEVLDGGTIRMGRLGGSGLEAAVGYIVAAEGSLMDASGVKADSLRLKSGSSVTAPVTVGSAGGTIDLRAREGLLLAGRLSAAAGSDQARAGTLSLTLDREDAQGGLAFPQNPRDLVISAAADGTLPTGWVPGAPVQGRDGMGRVPVTSFAGGGFANLRFKSQDSISLQGAGAGGSGAVVISASNSIELNAPTLQAASTSAVQPTQAQVTAPYVNLGNTDLRYQADRAAQDGGASLSVSASTIDLSGNSATLGFGRVLLAAQGDIRLVGSPLGDTPGAPGSFRTGRSLNLVSSQVYPTTLSSFELALSGADSRLEFRSNGRAANAAFSAAGSLLASADHIVQDGRVLAPFGTITLDAQADLRYEAGSLTSVAGQGSVPFGSVVNGTDWTYDLGGQTVVYRAGGGNASLGERALPVKTIVSRAAKVVQSAGAVLDLSGGGSLYAYEFTPGPGGSADVLQSSGGAANRSYAINPNYTSAVAPRDWQYGNDGLQVGDQVWLSGFAGLAAGNYTLLPAHYALLPGGYAIDPAAKTRDMASRDNRMNADTSLTVAGYRTSSTDGRGDTRMSGFTLTPYALIRKRSEFKDFNADSFFQAQAAQAGSAAPALPADGGQVVFDVKQQLVLDGRTRLDGSTSTVSGGPDGLRGAADIAAPMIEVVSVRPAGTGPYVSLQAGDLVALGAGSLLLGGIRTTQADGVHLNVTADTVRVNNNAATPLSGADIILAGRDTVQLTARSKVQALEPMQAAPLDIIIEPYEGSSDGALLRASSGAAVQVQRSAAPGRYGRLDIAPGAQLAAGASLYLDATQSMAFDGGLDLRDGSALAVHAPRIALGANVPNSADSVSFGTDGLTRLSRLSSLDLTSYGTIDTWGRVDLGRAGMDSLSLGAGAIVSHNADVRLAAQVLNLSGLAQGADAAPAPGAATGSLSATVGAVNMGAGQMQVQGFADVRLNAATQILATGVGSLVADNKLSLSAGRIASQAGASTRFAAGGALSLSALADSAALPAARLGGSLSFEADTITSTANITALAGRIDMMGNRGVAIDAGKLDVQGVGVAFGSTQADAAAGNITLDGGTGSVRLAAPAALDLSAQGAAAGSLVVRATGSADSTVVLDGSLYGTATRVAGEDAAGDPAAGRFSLDVARAPGGTALDTLNSRLNAAGFTQERKLRFRDGDVSVGAGNVVTARSISISADNGNVDLAGTLDARGAHGGTIEVYAAQRDAAGDKGRLTLAATARLLASATEAATSAAGSTGDGGRVVLGVANADGAAARRVDGGASLAAELGAQIDVAAAGSAGQGGTVVLKAPRVGSAAGADVAVARFGAGVLGSRGATIEAVKVYSASSISERADTPSNLDASLNGRMANEAADFMRSAATVASRLGRDDLTLTPGVEVRSAGNLSVSVNEDAFERKDRGWNLNSWRFGGQAGTLSLRAAGNLDLLGTLSDGFVKGANGAASPNWALDSSGKSWSLRLVGGADTSAADPLAVTASAARGDVRLGFSRAASADDMPVAMVRTGTGRIDIAAGRDVQLGAITLPDPDGDTTLDRTFGAAIYTAGHKANLMAGFKAPLNAGNLLYGAGELTAAAFGTGGGGVAISAQRDVIGAPVLQLVNNWLYRQGRSGVDAEGKQVFETVLESDGSLTRLNTAWWTRHDAFSSGVATFGGGDVRINAATGSVRDLSVNVASSAYLPGAAPGAAALVELGGGDLSVRAGQDIKGGSFYVQKGAAVLRADGAITAGKLLALDLVAPATDNGLVYAPVRPIIALGDARFDISAGKSLAIETAYNPTLTRQSLGNVPPELNPDGGFLNFDNSDPSALNYKQRYSQYSTFSTYAGQSQVKLTALGDVLLNNNALQAAAAGGAEQPLSDYGRDQALLFGYYPPSLYAASLAGNLTSGQGFAIAPSANGQLNLLAAGSVALASNNILFPAIVMLDNDPAAMTRPAAPTLLKQPELAVMRAGVNGLPAHTAGNLHADDNTPVRVVAKSGSITGQADAVASIILPKQAEILAGQDIRDLGFAIQHNRAQDETVVRAGRDVIDSTNFSNSSPVKHVVTGAGLLSVLAQRDLDLGNSQGVVTRGNLDNAYLPEGGASIVAIAGSASAPASDAQSPSDKLAGNEALFKSLVDASKENDALASFDALIAGALPMVSPGGGNINVFGSQFKTEQGGSLDLLAPSGSVNAGLVSVPVYLQNKSASEIGIYTVRGGAIRSLVRKDFVVNQGRVFTLGGGDITLVSQFGNIDAGRGSKTASSAPPPLLTTDANGNTRIDIAGSIAGSGIATLRTSPEQAPGNVYAVAPRGIFDAGDAGVRSTGFVAIQAAVVLNSNNIAASSGVSGSAAVTAGGPATAAAPAGTANTAQDAMKQMALAPKETLGLSVEVLGYGDTDDADADDPKDSEEERKKKRANRAKKL